VRECGREKKKWIGQVVKSKESKATPPPPRDRRGQKEKKKVSPFFKNYY
jgi:hypothetical protein